MPKEDVEVLMQRSGGIMEFLPSEISPSISFPTVKA
jgi:hypothetical protein